MNVTGGSLCRLKIPHHFPACPMLHFSEVTPLGMSVLEGPPRALASLVKETRRHLPPVTESRVLAPEAKALAAAFSARVFTP